MKQCISLLFLALLSCNSQPENHKYSKNLDWHTKDFLQNRQILLTNDYQLDNSASFGASSFLLKTNKGSTVLCTAKHLLGDAMGISPEVNTAQFNSALKFWNAFPRQYTLTDDTINGLSLINKEINSTDIILLNSKEQTTSTIQPLIPRLTEVRIGEQLELIGCEYADMECYQNSYKATMITFNEEGMYIIKPKKGLDFSGFSGAPVIDKNGYAIGVLSGGLTFEGELYLTIEPLTKVEQWLK